MKCYKALRCEYSVVNNFTNGALYPIISKYKVAGETVYTTIDNNGKETSIFLQDLCGSFSEATAEIGVVESCPPIEEDDVIEGTSVKDCVKFHKEAVQILLQMAEDLNSLSYYGLAIEHIKALEFLMKEGRK